ncbi:MAG TPA: hypothetical protein VEH27_09120 [Methylomirabilota bacterium]|nr:hypothetical protein [Methylomirabilota bacterium]
MKLSTLAVVLGVVFALPNLFALLKPTAFTTAARKFPRATPIGWFLTLAATAWFLSNLNAETIADFASYKKMMLIGFAALGILTCIFVPDFLPVRGLAALLLLTAHYTLNRTRWAESDLRLILVVWAYTWVIAGLWLTVSPWRLRDYLTWSTSSPSRLRAISAGCLAFAILVAILGLTAFSQPVQASPMP